MTSLYAQRIQKEKTAGVLDALLNGIYQHRMSESEEALASEVEQEQIQTLGSSQLPPAPLAWRLPNRNRLLESGITLEQAVALEKRFRSQRPSEITETQMLVEMGAPIERVIEYISAPSSSAGMSEGVPVKETIYNQIKRDYHQANQVDVKHLPQRVGYGLGAMAFVSSYSLIFLGVASLDPTLADRTAEAGLVFEKINHVMWKVLDWTGVPGSDMVSDSAPLGQLVALYGSLAFSEYQRKKGLGERANLKQKLLEPSTGVAEELFGQAQTQALEFRYELLTESDKHLLSHLRPYELRVMLLGSDDAAKDILRTNPPPFENEVLAAAHSSTGWGEHFSKMIYLALPKQGRKVVEWISSMKPTRPGENEIPYTQDDTKQLLSRLQRRRQPQAPALEGPLPGTPARVLGT